MLFTIVNYLGEIHQIISTCSFQQYLFSLLLLTLYRCYLLKQKFCKKVFAVMNIVLQPLY